MSVYQNTLGVVMTGDLGNTESTAAAPMIRSVIRDLKKWMADSGSEHRTLPLGYGAGKCGLILKTTFDYLAAGDSDGAIDFFCVSSTPLSRYHDRRNQAYPSLP